MVVRLIVGEGGHRSRCNVLASEFARRGMRPAMHTPDEVPEWSDILIVDLPLQIVMCEEDYNLWVKKTLYYAVMGRDDPDADYVWHPLGPGRQERNKLLVSDVCRDLREARKTTPPIYDVFYYNSLYPEPPDFPDGWRVAAPSAEHADALTMLSLSRYAVVGWGQTFFEAEAIGVPCLPVTDNDEYVYEALRYGVAPMSPYQVSSVSPERLGEILNMIRAPRLPAFMQRQAGARLVVDEMLECFGL